MAGARFPPPGGGVPATNSNAPISGAAPRGTPARSSSPAANNAGSPRSISGEPASGLKSVPIRGSPPTFVPEPGAGAAPAESAKAEREALMLSVPLPRVRSSLPGAETTLPAGRRWRSLRLCIHEQAGVDRTPANQRRTEDAESGIADVRRVCGVDGDRRLDPAGETPRVVGEDQRALDDDGLVAQLTIQLRPALAPRTVDRSI